jgi:hypothetical protein
MKISRSKLAVPKENPIVKRILLVLGAAVLFFNTLVIPTVVRADGGTGTTSCGGNSVCKP